MFEEHVCWMGRLRLRYGISQAELAKAAGVSRQLISQIELEVERQSSGHEAMIRRAFAEIIASRRKALTHLEQDLEHIPWLFSMSDGEDEYGF